MYRIYQFVRNRAYRRVIYPLCPFTRLVQKPIFIVGCGRSGTTILGRLIESHSQLAYLNEAGHIWHYDPQTDIWGPKSAVRKGKLVLTRDHLSPSVKRHVRRAFGVELHRQGGVIIVEKTPANTFRIDYLLGIFPDARFIHLIRNGVEVAHSIARRIQSGRWYKGRKWEMLVAYAKKNGLGHLPNLCQDNLDRGLFEWRMFVTAARRHLAQLPSQRQLEIHYRHLIVDSAKVCDQIEVFAGIGTSEKMRGFANSEIQRRSPRRNIRQLVARQRQIGGDLLEESVAAHETVARP